MNYLTEIFLYYLLFAPFIAYFGVKSIGSSMLHAPGIVALAIAILIILTKAIKGKKIVLPSYIITFFLFSLYVFIADIRFNLLTDGSIIRSVYLSNYFKTCLYLFLIENMTVSAPFIKNAIKIIQFLVVTTFIVLIIQYFDPLFLFPYADDQTAMTYRYMVEDYRLESIYAGLGLLQLGMHNSAYFALLAGLPRKNLFVTIICGATAALSRYRSSILGFIVALTAGIRKSKNFFASYMKWIFIIIAITTIVLVALSHLGVNLDFFYARVFDMRNASVRVLSFKVFSTFFVEHPFLGSGYNTPELQAAFKGSSPQIHVGFLAVLYLYGLLGGSLFYVSIFLFLRRLKKVALQSNYFGPYYAVLAIISFNVGMVILSLFSPALFIAVAFYKFFADHPDALKR